VTSSESWDTIGFIGLPPILVVFDYHNDSGKSSLEQASSEGLLFMTRPHLDRRKLSENFQSCLPKCGILDSSRYKRYKRYNRNICYNRDIRDNCDKYDR